MLDQQRGSFFGPKTLVDLLRHRANYKPDQTAFAYLLDGESEEISLSYADLDRQARGIAAWLQAHGLQGQRALLLYPPGLDFISAFFGCLYAGVVAVPAYPPRMNRSLARIEAIAADCDAHVALTTQSVFDRVSPMLHQTPDLVSVRWQATDQGQPGDEDAWRDPEVGPGSLAFLQYTSGSTGTPKGVVLTHGNLIHNCGLISHLFEQSQRTGMGVFWLPSYHDMGLVGGVLQPLYIGRPNVLMSPVAFLQRPLRWLQAISRYKATISGGPNFAYDLCVRKTTPEQREGLDLSRWTLAFNGAEPVRAETLDRFVEAFAPHGFRREAFYPCYGLAEATLIVSGGFKQEPPVVRSFESRPLENGEVVEASADDGEGRALVGSGQNLPDQKIVIADPETLTRCPSGHVGEIWVKGPSIAQGYWNRPEETEQFFRARLADTQEGPFLRTGDLGFLQEGELFITGRLKDLIIIRGLNHYPHDIELTVEHSHPGLRPSCGAAFTVDDEDGQRMVIVYEVERTRRNDAAQICESIRRDVARDHELLVDEIVLIKSGSIPKTSSGKIQRHACRAALADGTLDVVARWEAGQATAADEGVARSRANGSSAPEPHFVHARRGANRRDAQPAGGFEVESEPWQAAGGRNGDAPHGADQGSSVVNGNGNHGRSAPRSRSEAPQVDKAQAVLDEVRRIAKERAAGLTLDTTITDLGMDSLERMEILAALEERFGGRFPEDVMPQLETCREVLSAVETYLGNGQHKQHARANDEIPTEHYRFAEYPEYVRLRQSLELVEESGLGNPFFNVHQQLASDTTVVDGRELINFSGFNYIGMSGDPTVAAAAKAAIDRYGTSVSASRLVSGDKVVHRELEQAIAELVGAEEAIVFVGGHATNETTVGHLFGPGDLILHDALAHNSIVQGSILSGARRRPFPHNDWRAVDRLLTELRGEYRRVLVAIEGVYSMDGDIPDLPKFIEVKKRHKAFLMVDEAHSIGVLGRHGRGIGEYYGVHPADVDLWMGTLSKAFGSCGGYIAGCREVVEYLKYTAPGFVFSVGITPANSAAALAAIRLLEEEPQRPAILRERSRLFLGLAREHGMNTGSSKDSPVVPIIIGNSLTCLQLSRAMAARGVNVQPILHPAVEEKAARLRFFITSNHSEEQIRYTVQALAEELARIDPGQLKAQRNGVHRPELEGAPR